MILPNDLGNLPLFINAKPHIKGAGTLLDVGAGIRPQSLVTCERHICVEPHDEYADALEAAGFKVIREAAPVAFDLVVEPVHTVALFDVIEHMEKEAGLETISRACAIADQVIVFTPLGFLPQSGGEAMDAWGMHGQHWQRHRSGWAPEDFPGWIHLVDENFAPGHAAFIAIWDRS